MDLTRNAGGILTEMTKDEIFKAMRRLAMREQNTMMAKVTLHNMRQDQDEPILWCTWCWDCPQDRINMALVVTHCGPHNFM